MKNNFSSYARTGLITAILVSAQFGFTAAGTLNTKTPDVNANSASQSGPAPAGSADNMLFTGSFLYTIPIEVPPGLAGMEPALTLDYNSSQGNGWVGVGWDLSLGSIQRSTKKGVPAYIANDTFVFTLKGRSQELTLIKSEDPNFEFQSKIENSFLKFRLTPAGWVVTDKMGTRYFFGQTADSRIDGPINTFQWALDKVVDRNGNAFRVTYVKDQNQLYPLNIFYTFNEASTPARAYDRRITFDLETRPDPIVSYRAGFKQTTAKRLLAVQTMVLQEGTWTLVRTYGLTYAVGVNRVRSQLTTVQLTGKRGTETISLPLAHSEYLATGSGWGSNPSASFNIPEPLIIINNITGGYISLDLGVRFADLNADGKTDMLVGRHTVNASGAWEDTRAAYLNTGLGWINAGSTWVLPRMFTNLIIGNNADQNYVLDNGLRILDINGDGRADLVHAEKPSAPIAIFINNGAGWTNVTGSWSFPANTYFTKGNFAYPSGLEFAELNGDGLPDLVQSDGSTRLSWIQSASSWVPDNRWAPPVELSDGRTRLVDVNGDGLTDIIEAVFYHDDNRLASKVYLNTGGGWQLADYGAPAALMRQNDLDRGDRGVQFVDVNSDGLLDWVESISKEPNNSGIIGISPSGHSSRIYLNTGNGWVQAPSGSFSFPQPFTIFNGDRSHSTGVVFVDINNDGQPELAQSNTQSGTLVKRIYISEAKPELLKTVRNALGGSVNATYACSFAISGTHRIPFPIQVLNRLSNSDGRGNNVDTSYTYDLGLFSSTPQEFLGFGKVSSIDAEGNQSVSYYHQDKDIFGVPVPNNALKGNIYKLEHLKSSGNLVTKRETIWQYSQPVVGKEVYFVRPASMQDTIYDGGAPATTEIAYGYDGYGNVNQTFFKGDTALAGDERTEKTFYATPADSATYRVAFPMKTQVWDANGTLVAENQYQYDGTPTTQLPPGTVDKGNVTQFHRWLSVPNSFVTSKSEYNSYGQITAVIDANGIRTQTVYDSFGFPSQVTNALGHTVKSLTDPLTGNVFSDTDPNNQVTSYIYDALGRLTSVIGPMDTVSFPGIVYNYRDDLRGNPAQQHVEKQVRVNPGQPQTLWRKTFLDGLGRAYKTESKDIAGKSVNQDTQFNNRGLVSRVSVPYFSTASPSQWTETLYDSLGRVIQVINPDNTRTVTRYTGRTTQVEDANGKIQTSDVDAHGRVIIRREPSIPNPTVYRYDAVGNLVEMTDSLGKKTSFVYDSLGRKLAMTDPSAGTWRYAYDANGNLIRQTDARGVVISLYYDVLNRLLSKTLTADPTRATGQRPGVLASYIYDQVEKRPFSKGRLTTVSDPSGVTKFYHDNLGRTTRQIKTIGGVNYAVVSGFNALGAPTRTAYPNNLVVTYAYDEAGRLSKIANTKGTVYATYSGYDELGRIMGFTQGAGKTRTTYSYDPVKMTLSALKIESNATGTYQPLKSWSYIFDGVGNLKTITDQLVPVRTQTFQYDPLNRIVQAQGEYGNQAFNYDALGNFLNKNGTGYIYGDAARPYAVTRTTSAAGATLYGYDANGNIVSRAVNGSTWTYRFDAQNRLSQVKKGTAVQATFVYDADGGRVKKITPTGTTLYVGKLFEKRPDGALVDHVFGSGGGLICDLIIKGTSVNTLYYHPDHLGSTSLVTNSAGNKVQELLYAPFGETYSSSGSSPLRHKYTGQEEDPEIGLYYYNARYYDPALGRFISPDSIVPSAMDPQSLNRYAYVRNNPLVLTDPDGHFFAAIAAIVGAVAGAYAGHRIAQNHGYNLSNIETWGYMAAGAGIGALSGGIGGSIVGGGGVMANTLGIAVSSFYYSGWMSGLSGGAISPMVSYGFGSQNLATGKSSTLFDGDNEWFEDAAYTFGAMANLQDAVAGFWGTNVTVNSASIKNGRELWGHSSISDSPEKINVSVGPADGVGKNIRALKIIRGKQWDNHASDASTWKIPLSNVNSKILARLTTNIAAEKGLIFGNLNWNVAGFSCVNHTSRALLLSGIPTLPINFHPIILNAQLMIRQIGIFGAPYAPSHK